MHPDLSDDEIDRICGGLTQPAHKPASAHNSLSL